MRCAEGSDHKDRPERARFGSARVNDPGEFIAAVPAALGFRPEKSLVVGVLCEEVGESDTAVLDIVARFDLAHPSNGQPVTGAALAAAVVRVCAKPGTVGVLAVLVDEGAEVPPPGTAGQHPVVAALERRLTACDVPLHGAWAVGAVAAGRPWWSVRGPDRRGIVPDPLASVVALSHVLDGRQIRRTRAELTEAVAVDAIMRERVAAELGDAVARAHDRYAEAAHAGDPLGYSRRTLEYVLWQIACVDSGDQLSARELAEVAAALRDRQVRDTMFALTDTVHACAAERLWAQMTRTVPGTDRAEAATLLGYCAYVRGDGPFAGVAFETALDTEPEHPMAVLLQTALESGMRPSQLRRLARCGRETATDLGIDLGAGTC